MRGFIDVLGSWKIIWISALKGRNSRERSRAMSMFPTQIWPSSGFSIRVVQRATVDFPDPELPTRLKVLPGEISKVTPFAAQISELVFPTRAWVWYRLRNPHTRSVTPASRRICESIGIYDAIHTA